MKKTVILKKPQATPEEDISYLLDKMDYMLRKVEHYDRALNEFNIIKTTIEESATNSRNSKNMVQKAGDILSTHQNDLNSLSNVISDLSDRMQSQFDFLNDRINTAIVKSQQDRQELERKIDKLSDQIQKELALCLTLDHLAEIKQYREMQDRQLSVSHTTIKHTHSLIYEELENLKKSYDESKEKMLLIKKDICRLQNALVRKGVSVDNQ